MTPAGGTPSTPPGQAGVSLARQLLLWVLVHALGRRRSPAFSLCMRWLETLRPWSMLEVCLLGAMVAVFKLAGLLDVLPGIGLFALAVLSLMMIRIAGRDIRDLWDIL